MNHGYYGTARWRADGEVFLDDSPVPLGEHEVRWTSDWHSEADAVAVWRHREFITAGLRERGFSPRRAVRVAALVNRDTETIVVSPYDQPSDFEPFSVPLARP